MTDKEKLNNLIAKQEQSIEYKDERINELQKENEDLKSYIENLSENHADEWQKQQEVITSLKKQIEAFLSCKNCPNNKGGYICDVEYKGKCLTQKVQEIKELKNQIEHLKKNQIAWHKVTCFDKPDENGYVTANSPAEEGKEYLVRIKEGFLDVQELMYSDAGFYFEDYDWEDIEEWAELT